MLDLPPPDAAPALIAEAPSPDIAPLDCPYGPLIGAWRVRTIDYGEDGTKHEAQGEWFFFWALEGRAVMDVWISPPRSERGRVDAYANRYGTSVRAYDPVRKQWRVTWINPASGAYDTLWARRDGGAIVHEGPDRDGNLMRWTFKHIRERSAHWTGERSKDGGETWRLEAEFHLER